MLHEGARPITGLAFKSSGKDVYLFVVTEIHVSSINISNKDMKVGVLRRAEERWGGVLLGFCFCLYSM